MTGSDPQIYATLTNADRVWAIGAIHGEYEKLRNLHAELRTQFGMQISQLFVFTVDRADCPDTISIGQGCVYLRITARHNFTLVLKLNSAGIALMYMKCTKASTDLLHANRLAQ